MAPVEEWGEGSRGSLPALPTPSPDTQQALPGRGRSLLPTGQS